MMVDVCWLVSSVFTYHDVVNKDQLMELPSTSPLSPSGYKQETVCHRNQNQQESFYSALLLPTGLSPLNTQGLCGWRRGVMGRSIQSLLAVHHSSCPPHRSAELAQVNTRPAARSVYLITQSVFLSSL